MADSQKNVKQNASTALHHAIQETARCTNQALTNKNSCISLVIRYHACSAPANSKGGEKSATRLNDNTQAINAEKVYVPTAY